MKILCATDLLPKSESAIDRAGMLSDLLNADLSLLHVVMPPGQHECSKRTGSTPSSCLRGEQNRQCGGTGPSHAFLYAPGVRRGFSSRPCGS